MSLSVLSLFIPIVCAFFFPPTPQTNIVLQEKHPNIDMFLAIERKNQEDLMQAMKNCSDKNLRINNTITPLSFALDQRNYEACINLMKEGFTVTDFDLQKMQLLHALHLEKKPTQPSDLKILGQENIVLEFIHSALNKKQTRPGTLIKPEHQIIIDLQGKDYQLMKATECNDFAAITNLVHNGANPNSVVNGVDPLTIAIVQGHDISLQKLLDLGAEPKTEHLLNAELRLYCLTLNSNGDVSYQGFNPEKKEKDDLKKRTNIFKLLQRYLRL